MVRAQLYLHSKLREKFKKPYNYYTEIYFNRVVQVFENIDVEAEELARNHYEELGQYFDPDIHDESDFAERAIEKGLEYYDAVSLVKYNNKLMWISTMYQFWEQQVRKFLFDELKQSITILYNDKGQEIDFRNFCAKGILEIKEEFRCFEYDIERMKSWSCINELRLLANVIKHGDGGAATSLEKLRPDFFKSEITEFNLMKSYRTVLNEQVLNIDDSELIKYKEALNSFWDELPERLYCELEEI